MKIFVVDKRPNFRWRCRSPCVSFFITLVRPLLLFGISLSQLEKPRVQSPLLAQWSQIMLQDTGWFMAAPAHSHQHWTLIITGDRVCCIKSSKIKSQWNPFTMTFSSDQGMKPGLSLPARHKSCGNYKTFFSSSETNPFSPCWSGWCGYWMPRLPRVYCLPD